MATTWSEVDTTECDKEIAAREPKDGAFAAFLAWIGQREWRFCSLALDDRLYPVDDRLVSKLLPTPDEGGSQELGEWLEYELPGLTLCEYALSNYERVLARVKAENGGGTPWHWTPRLEMDYMPEGWYPVRLGITDLLAAYFGIDLQRASKERAALLAAIRKGA